MINRRYIRMMVCILLVEAILTGSIANAGQLQLDVKEENYSIKLHPHLSETLSLVDQKEFETYTGNTYLFAGLVKSDQIRSSQTPAKEKPGIKFYSSVYFAKTPGSITPFITQDTVLYRKNTKAQYASMTPYATSSYDSTQNILSYSSSKSKVGSGWVTIALVGAAIILAVLAAGAGGGGSSEPPEETTHLRVTAPVPNN